MPKRSKLRSRRNRPQRNRLSGQIAKVSSGLPIVRRIRGDPPPVNHCLTQSVVVSFDINIYTTNVNSKPQFAITIASNPYASNSITLEFSSASSGVQPTGTFTLTREEVFAAASTRVFGSYADVSCSTDANYILTQYAVQSVRFYGPVECGSISLATDFGPGLPGAFATDQGTNASRPCVKVSSPRLFWSKRSSCSPDQSTDGMIVGAIVGYTKDYPSLPVGTYAATNDQARLDITVHVRRGWSDQTSTQGTTFFVRHAGEQLPVEKTV